MMEPQYKEAKLEVLKRLRRDLAQLIASEGGDQEMSEDELSETIEDAAGEVEGLSSEAPALPEASPLEDDEEAYREERRKYFQGASPMPKSEGSASIIVASKSSPKPNLKKSIEKAMGPAPKKGRGSRKAK